MDIIRQKELIESVEKTRALGSQIVGDVIVESERKSEFQIRDQIVERFSKEDSIYPGGWYDPPSGGVAVLSDIAPYKRLKFSTLRNPESWPRTDNLYEKDSVCIVYVSPVDRNTKMFGDFGVSVYRGPDIHIRNHLKNALETVLQVADETEVGMKFSQIYHNGQEIFKNRGLEVTPWIRTHADPTGINLGHTAPGSYGEKIDFGSSFDDVKEAIRTKRLFTNSIEMFEVPQSGCFTVEARLVNVSDPTLPPVFFHVIVAWDAGKKKILTNYEDLFAKLDMNYMLKGI